MRKLEFVFWTTLIATATPGIALAQDGSVKAIYEKYNMLGTFAQDCSRPASPTNNYYVSRMAGANHVQRDTMDGPTARARFTMIDKVEVVAPNEVRTIGPLTGKIGNNNFDRTPTDSVWRIEPNRIRFVEVTIGDRKVATGGRFTGNNQETPWLIRCGR
jgi:hypothetical protein